MTESDRGREAPLEERLEDHLDRAVTQLVARALRGDSADDSGMQLARIAGRISELLRATQLLKETRSRAQRFVDALEYAHRDNVRRSQEGGDVSCGCRLTPECVRLDVSPLLLARLSGFNERMIERLAELDASDSHYDPGTYPVEIWRAVRDDELVEGRVVPRARERLATAIMWTLGERLTPSAFELGEAAAALSDLIWMDEDAADEFCDSVQAAHERLTRPERMQSLGLPPGSGHCACRTTASCYSPKLSPRSVIRQLITRGLLKDLDDPELDARLIGMDLTGMPDPADVAPTATPTASAPSPPPVRAAPRPPGRPTATQTAELQDAILRVLRASPHPLAARDIAAIVEGDLDGRRAGQLLRGLRTRSLVERHTFSDENTGWAHTTWTAIPDDDDW